MAKNRKEDDVIVFSLSTENAAGTGGGTEEATLRDKIAGRDQNGAKGAAGQDIQKYCLIAYKYDGKTQFTDGFWEIRAGYDFLFAR